MAKNEEAGHWNKGTKAHVKMSRLRSHYKGLTIKLRKLKDKEGDEFESEIERIEQKRKDIKAEIKELFPTTYHQKIASLV